MGFNFGKVKGLLLLRDLASGLEKAWLTLHIQETTATVLTATLASKKPETTFWDRHIQPSEAGTQAAASEVIEENKSHEPAAETSSKSFNVRKSQTVEDERSTCPTEEDKKSPSSLVTNTDNIIADHASSGAEDGLLAQEKIVSNHTGAPTGGSELSPSDIKVGDKKAESMDDVVPRTVNNNKKVNVSSDVHLNIRLPDGISLQEKFSVTSTLRMVKDYVDRNQAIGTGAYDLAIPYPRKIFSDQDLNKSLSELSLLNRQALIVVFHQRAASYHQRVQTHQVLGQAQSGSWDHGPDSTSQNNTPRMDRPSSSSSPYQNSSSTGRNDSKGKQPTTSHAGSNIHTLKHDEDDSRFSERNYFWNGNSTEYGGDNDAK
ncbi:hypothetical protein OIU77_002951 [Salix suchowensis]|uniref:UBX domain-containing protein n=1 Tax=Salix suchowensis TaxID=1278906 RepID=A0ABQ9AY01_9ROSI|nr:hypothetical protein OIU77_002951 [Salix suchowensis]